ncbi:MAG: YbjN domain-containing protein [Verrucomicrobiota bacterium]
MKNDDSKEYSESDILAIFARHLDEAKWKYHYTQGQQAIFSGFNGKDALWDFSMIARAKNDGLFHLSVNSYIPNKAGLARQAAAAEIISRINWQLALGCFEMNHADGEIRFRTSLAIAGADITPDIIAHLIHSNLYIVDERLSQILAVLYSHKSPESVLQPKMDKSAIAKVKTQRRFELN